MNIKKETIQGCVLLENVEMKGKVFFLLFQCLCEEVGEVVGAEGYRESLKKSIFVEFLEKFLKSKINNPGKFK